MGEILIGCSDSDGKIYYWNPSASNPLSTAAVLTNAHAPTANTSILVSKERHLIAFGAGGNPKKIQWSTQEDYSTATSGTNNAWYPTATNSAGSFEISTTGKIKIATKVANIILVQTDVDCHEMRYISPLISTQEENLPTLAGLFQGKQWHQLQDLQRGCLMTVPSLSMTAA